MGALIVAVLAFAFGFGVSLGSETFTLYTQGIQVALSNIPKQMLTTAAFAGILFAFSGTIAFKLKA